MIRLRTLAVLFILVLILVLGTLLRHLERLSQDSVRQASELVLLQTSQHVEARVGDFLAPAARVLAEIERSSRLATMGPKEPAFYQWLEGNPRLSEITFTSGRRIGQLSVFRDGSEIVSVLVDSDLQARQRRRQPGTVFRDVLWKPLGKRADPSQHPTFTTPRQFFLDGDHSPLWSDLSYSQRGGVGVTVQSGVAGPGGVFLGVARVGLNTEQLGHAFDQVGLELGGVSFSAFLCDSRGRLITPVQPGGKGRVAEDGDDLRVIGQDLPPQVASVLKRIPPEGKGAILLREGAWLACLRRLRLENTQDWWVGLVVRESDLVGNLPLLRQQLLTSALLGGGLVALLVIGLFGLLRRELRRLHQVALRMRDFDFEARGVQQTVREVGEVAAALEAAKTTLRAMVKYVPVELVRQLFEARLEPVLGSQPREVVLMFSDIAGFTSMAEKLTPARLSEVLGTYLALMNRLIQGNQGTVLERVGDALLSLWNAPVPVANGEELACRTALRCQSEIAALPDSAMLGTRFGIHRDEVLVGHFGSPDRLNYGVLGDPVNLASRLEGLNKQYGTSILISENVRTRLGPEFAVRKLDRVAVKGKNQGILIYELLLQGGEFVTRYEQAFELYSARNFSQAINLLEGAEEDEPSRRLLARCRDYLQNPPEPDWDGVYRAREK
ncbi:MAG: adenylate/guanylate cyclase domain-containing protein [Vulcanimicrobiota bacterium]